METAWPRLRGLGTAAIVLDLVMGLPAPTLIDVAMVRGRLLCLEGSLGDSKSGVLGRRGD